MSSQPPPPPPPELEDFYRSAMEQVRQQRAERWIFIREVAIVLLVAAAVAARVHFGG